MVGCRVSALNAVVVPSAREYREREARVGVPIGADWDPTPAAKLRHLIKGLFHIGVGSQFGADLHQAPGQEESLCLVGIPKRLFVKISVDVF